MSVFLKKFLLSFLSFLVLFFSIAPRFAAAKAAGTWYSSSFPDWFTKVYKEENSPASEIFGERYTAAQVQWVFYGLAAIPINFITGFQDGLVNCVYSLSTFANDDIFKCGEAVVISYAKIWTALNLVSLLADNSTPNYTLAKDILEPNQRPISGVQYIRNLGHELSPVNSAKAQGYGYSQLQTSIQKYWSGFRNMAYAIVVLITIIFAFMVMFKMKLDPQTVITVQSALPKIIGGVILATFSFAIAGLLIDLMYVVGGIFAWLLQAADFAGAGSYEVIMHPFAGVLDNFTIFWYMFAYAIMFALALIFAILTIAGGSLIIFGSYYGTITSLVFILLWVWIVVLMVWYTIKIPWVLIKNLISIYISIVTAPLQIMVGTLVPSLGFGQWLKKLISELLVYPVTGLFMILAVIMLGSSVKSSISVFTHLKPVADKLNDLFGVHITTGVLWAPDIIGGTGAMSPLLWLAASFSLIALLPKVIDLMKSLVMGERFSFGSAMQEATAPLYWARDRVTNSYAFKNISDYYGTRQAVWLLEHKLAKDIANSKLARAINKRFDINIDASREAAADAMKARVT